MKVDGKTIKARAKRESNPLILDEKYMGSEPVWDAKVAEKMEPAEFETHLRRSFRYYNYFHDQKSLKKHIVRFMKESGEYTPAELKAFDRGAEREVPMTVCSLIMAFKAGMPFRKQDREYVTKRLKQAIFLTAPEVAAATEEVAKKSNKPTIQDRLAEKTAGVIGELEGIYDDVHLNKGKAPSVYDFLVSNNVPQSKIGKFEDVYAARRAELVEAQAGKDEQLVDGYRVYGKADFKRMIAFIDQIVADLEQYRHVKKATKRQRVKKAPNKEKVVARIKFMKEHKDLKLVSINPADIVGAQVLWVYNVKSRKLGQFVADETAGQLSVKGTTILGFDEAKSVCKTLRKPADQLKSFMKAGKVELRSFLKDIRAVETKLRSRTSKEMILLKVQ